ncbi:putative membrane protein YeaQ/YmgE (transglycosylase-associated protein family) [Roseovarius sp. MBR-51]
MIVIIGAILGALTGALMAWRRKGKLADILQYAFVLALIFALLGLFLTLIIHRSVL